MDTYYKGKIKVNLNNNFIGYASSVGIQRDTGGAQVVNLIIERALINKKINGEGNEKKETEDNYQAFFQKFSKAFSKK